MRLNVDIRTKMIVLFLGTSAVSITNNIFIETGVVLAIALLQLLSGPKVFMPKILALYGIFVFIQYCIFPIVPNKVSMIFSVFVVNLRCVIPTLMAFVWIYKTTKVSELIATMTKMRVPKSVTVTIAIVLRFFPTIIEEWGHIKDAMNIRGIKTSSRNPFKSIYSKIECYYVPLLICASKTADELSSAAITRGIDNPKKPTCRSFRKMNFVDYFLIAISIFATVLAIYINASYGAFK